ncbi:hypothetical protein Pcinc_019677 [Petrolisthes cinctipes]|uniref:Uncharacterized protein n=1 Tax=Petrolisthes cinctipes TaxID=88211 RepID=A0AAE1FL29_PETCI|nr:hypothetical protein Pcinc_019677 [Petrolisthes cinctipes]
MHIKLWNLVSVASRSLAENYITPTSPVPSARTCILHIERASTSDPPRSEVLSFNPQKWAVVKKAVSLRKLKKNFPISKYFQVVQSLPDDVDTSHGYHVQCYKNFTAVPQDLKTAPGDAKAKQLRSSAPPSPALSSTGVFSIQCIFCKKVQRKKGQTEERLMSCETKQAEATIKDAVKARNDHELLASIASIDFIAKEVKYHHSCRRLYTKLASSIGSPVDDKMHTSIRALTGNVVYVKGLPVEAMCSAFDYIHSPEAAIRKAALILRQEIKGVQKMPLPEYPTLQDLKAGEGSPPEILLMFFRVLYGGLSAVPCSPRVERYASSIIQDALFMTS